MVSGSMSMPRFWCVCRRASAPLLAVSVAAVVELAAAGVVEADVAVGAAADGVAAFVDQFVVEPAQRQQVGEGGGAFVAAVADVVGVDAFGAAAGEAALAVA